MTSHAVAARMRSLPAPHFRMDIVPNAITSTLIKAVIFLLLCGAMLSAQADTGIPAINKAIQQTLQAQTANAPGKVSIEIGQYAPNPRFQPCTNWIATLPDGARAWGPISVNVRCTQGSNASLYVSVRIRIYGKYLVASHPIAPGQTIDQSDLNWIDGELTALPNDLLTDPQQAVGRVARSPIPAERPLRGAMLKRETWVQAGQEVQIVAVGEGFRVSNNGAALDSGAQGESVRVRMPNGQIISGLVRDRGLVETRP